MSDLIIGIDASRLNITDTPTGIERVSFELIPRVVDNLLKEDKVSEIWLYSSKELDNVFVKYGWFNNSKVKQKVLKIPFRLFWTLIRLTLHFLNPFTKKPDIFWVPSHILPLYLPKRTQGFQHMHDIAYRSYPESYSWKSKLILELGMKVAKFHDVEFIYISQFTKNDVNRYYPWVKNRGEVVHLGWEHLKVDHVNYKSNREIKDPYILYVSRIEEKKGTRFLLLGFDLLKDKFRDNLKFKDLKLVLVGKRGFGYEKFEKTLNNIKYKESIIIKGFIDDLELQKLMNNASVFVIPSMYEGFGITALEAYSYGIPLVCSDRTSLPEVAGDGAVYFNPEDTEALSDSIFSLLTDDKLCSDKTQKGRDRLNMFSWDKSALGVTSILLSKTKS